MGHAAHDYCWRGVCASTTRDTLPCSLSARRGSHISPLFLRTSPSPKRRDLFAVSSAAQTSPLLTFATLRRRHHLRLAPSAPPGSASLRLRLLKDCLIRSTSRPD